MTDIDEEELDETSGNEDKAMEEPVLEEVESTENTDESVEDGEAPSEPEEVVADTPSYSGSDAFVVFVRHGDKVLFCLLYTSPSPRD